MNIALGREDNRYGRAFSHLTGERQLTAMQFSKHLTKRQAQTRSFMALVPVYLTKNREGLLNFALWNPDTRIGDREMHLL